ncbi:MAG: ABC transporter ATP-binding protein [Desulfacinum sp.]|jgi:branched-chain amino acid transport system ATP-binding protein|nr:ABC transporter ATP-binding protein [Desulfacinum sp.]MBZ4660068.1 transporter related [Desulfacinum sp.]
MKQRPILSVEDVHHSFGKFAALSGVSLQVPEGRLTALIGPNGAGKTTFYNVVSGRYRPSRGKVRFRGRDVTGLPPHRVCARGLARSFQITNIFERLTVLENVLVPLVVKNGGTFCFWRRLKGDKALERAALEVLAMVGLEDKAHLDVHELPYGDKRLVEMAIVLAGRPQMVLLDEPTAGMNPEETDHMIRLIKSLAETSGTTFFITEHDMKVVFSVADYIYVLHQGKLLAEGTPEQIRADRRVKEAYLGGTSEP